MSVTKGERIKNLKATLSFEMSCHFLAIFVVICLFFVTNDKNFFIVLSCSEKQKKSLYYFHLYQSFSHQFPVKSCILI